MEVVILIRWSVHLHLCVVNVSVHVFVHKNEEAQKALQVGELEIRGKKLTISDAIKKYNAPSNNCNYITMFLSDSFIYPFI